MHRHLATGLCLATLLAVTACGGDDDPTDASGSSTDARSEVDGSGVSSPDDGSTVAPDDSGGDPSTTVAGAAGTTVAGSGTTVSGAGTTIAGSGTTVAGSGTTAAPPTTNAVPVAPSDLVLLADGIGPLRFGIDSQAMVDAISAVLGAPTSDAAGDYPIPAEDGSFQTSDGELAFGQPFGRTVCWTNGLCTESAGATAGPYAFVGWYYAATDTSPLFTVDGLGVGSTWADFEPVMTVEPGGCYTIGSGTSNGIELSLESKGTPFGEVDDAGNITPRLPDPPDVFVVQMQAGDQVVFLVGDC